MSEKSLYDTIAGLFGGGGGEAQAVPPAKVMSPPPPQPVQKKGESNLDFSLRQLKWKTEMDRRKLKPEDFMISEAAPSPENDRFDRRRQIEEAIDAND